jgi:hypothetical protein
MNIIEEIKKLKEQFEAINRDEPNCVKLGKKEIQEVENWYNGISKTEINKKVKVKDGNIIMGMHVIKTKDKSFLEVTFENLEKYITESYPKWKTVLLNSDYEAKVEVNDD